MEDITEVDPICKLNSLIKKLTISIDIVHRIKVAQVRDEEFQGFITSLEQVKNGEDRIIRFDGWLSVLNSGE